MKCYYYPEKECKWGCYWKCDEEWDFVAGGSPCRIAPPWLKAVWAVLFGLMVLCLIVRS